MRNPGETLLLSRLLPRVVDNTSRGLPIATWLLAPILLMKLLMGGNAAVITRSVATAADGLPLDSFGSAGEHAVLNLLSLWGLQQALVALFGVLILFRYRAMIPPIYALLLVEQLGRKVLQQVHPIAVAAAPSAASLPIGVIVNSVLLLMLMAGFAFSLLGSGHRSNEGS